MIGEAGTGREAVALSTQLQPDLVLMDIRMPDLDGLMATRAIKQKPAMNVFKAISLKVRVLNFHAHTPEAAWFAAANWIRLHEEHDPKAIGAPSASPTSGIEVQP